MRNSAEWKQKRDKGIREAAERRRKGLARTYKGARFYDGPQVLARKAPSREMWWEKFMEFGPKNLTTRLLGAALYKYTKPENPEVETFVSERTLMRILNCQGAHTVIEHSDAGAAEGWWRVEKGKRGEMRQPGIIRPLTIPDWVMTAQSAPVRKKEAPAAFQQPVAAR